MKHPNLCAAAPALVRCSEIIVEGIDNVDDQEFNRPLNARHVVRRHGPESPLEM